MHVIEYKIEMDIEERSFIKDTKSLYKKRQYRKLVERMQNKIKQKTIFQFSGSSIFELFILQCKASQELIERQFMSKVQDQQLIASLLGICFRNIRECYSIIRKEMSLKMFYSAEAQDTENYGKELGKIKLSKVLTLITEFVKITLKIYILLYFLLSSTHKNLFFRQSKPMIFTLLAQLTNFSSKHPSTGLLTSQLFIIFSWEQMNIKMYKQAQNHYYNSFLALHHLFSLFKTSPIKSKQKRLKLIRSEIETFLVIGQFVLIRMKIQEHKYEQILELGHNLKYMHAHFVHLSGLWKQYLKEMILNLQILKIKIDSELQDFAIPYLMSNFPYLNRAIQVYGQQKLSQKVEANSIFHQPVHQTVREPCKKYTLYSIDEIGTSSQLQNETVPLCKAKRKSGQKSSVLNSRDSMHKKLKKVIFNRIEQGNKTQCLISNNTGVETSHESKKIDILNKSYSALPIKRLNGQKSISKINKKKCGINLLESCVKNKKKNKVFGDFLIEDLSDTTEQSLNLYKKEIRNIKYELQNKKQSNCLLTRTANYDNNSKYQKCNRTESALKKQQQRQVRKIISNNSTDILQTQIAVQNNKTKKAPFPLFLDILQNNLTINGHSGKKRKPLRLEQYFQKLETLQAKQQKIHKQNSNGINFQKLLHQKFLMRPTRCNSIVTSRSIHKKGKSSNISELPQNNQVFTYKLNNLHTKSHQINSYILNRIKNSNEGRSNRNSRLKRNGYINNSTDFIFGNLM